MKSVVQENTKVLPHEGRCLPHIKTVGLHYKVKARITPFLETLLSLLRRHLCLGGLLSSGYESTVPQGLPKQNKGKPWLLGKWESGTVRDIRLEGHLQGSLAYGFFFLNHPCTPCSQLDTGRHWHGCRSECPHSVLLYSGRV